MTAGASNSRARYARALIATLAGGAIALGAAAVVLAADASESEKTAIQEIAPQAPVNSPQGEVAEPSASPSVDNGVAEKELERYRQSQDPPQVAAPRLHSLQEFMAGGTDDSPIGVQLREDSRTLKSGEHADGLLIVRVRSGSPAARAGLRSYSATPQAVLEGAAVAAAVVFPPAILGIAVIDQTHLGESYDMIIGVDGKRITNFLDFADQTRDLKPGDILYLSIVRNGRRLQIPVHVPEGIVALPY